MTNLEIVKSTYEGKTSEENGRALAAHVAENVQWTEAKGFPYAGTYTGLEEITKMFSAVLGANGLITNSHRKIMWPVITK
nr:hypothetical protein [Elizabethkingia bruuniana]